MPRLTAWSFQGTTQGAENEAELSRLRELRRQS